MATALSDEQAEAQRLVLLEEEAERERLALKASKARMNRSFESHESENSTRYATDHIFPSMLNYAVYLKLHDLRSKLPSGYPGHCLQSLPE